MKDDFTQGEVGFRAPVTVIGLGMMGTALADAFLKSGHPTTVWNRSTDKADPLVDKGATRAATVAEAVTASRIIVVCVSDYEVMYEILDPIGDALSGRVIVNLTSGTPEQAREAEAWITQRGADYLDGAIMAVPPMIGHPETLIFYGGDESAYETLGPTLMTLGSGSTYLDADPGVPLLYDLALLGMLWSNLAGYLHALALVGTAKVEAATFLPYAQAWFDNVIAPDIPAVAREVDERDYATDVSSLDVNRAAIAHRVRDSEAQDIRPDIMLPIRDLMERRVAEGHGADGLSSLIETMRSPTAKEGHLYHSP